jgi:hypothetical protein
MSAVEYEREGNLWLGVMVMRIVVWMDWVAKKRVVRCHDVVTAAK